MVKIDNIFLREYSEVSAEFGKWYISANVEQSCGIKLQVFTNMPFITQVGILQQWMASRHIAINTCYDYVHLTYVKPDNIEDVNTLAVTADTLVKSIGNVIIENSNYVEAVNAIIVKYFKHHKIPF